MDNGEIQADISVIRAELREIISQVSGADVSGVPDDMPLLEYVTSSLALVEGLRQLYDRFGVLIPIRRVLEGQANLGAISLYVAQALEQRKKNGPAGQAATSCSTEPTARAELPLEASQRHIGFLTRYSSGAAAAFNEPLLARLEGPLDIPALQAAIHAVGQHHEALRAALSRDVDALELLLDASVELPVSHCAPERLEQRLGEIVRQPFAEGERLFRAELLCLSETEYVLVLVGHALVIEDEALANVLREIGDIYGALSRGERPPATAPTTQATEYLAQDDRERALPARLAATEYWQETFAQGVPQLDLPSDRPRRPVKNYDGARLVLPIEPDLDARLRAWTQAQGLTPFAAFLGAFSILLHRLAGQNEIVIGAGLTPIGPRVLARTRNMMPVRSRYEPGRAFAEHARDQAVSLAETYNYSHLSLAELIQTLKLPRDQGRSAMFTAALRAQALGPTPVFDSLRVSLITPPAPGARYDLELTLASAPSGMHVYCDYSTELFDADTVLGWLRGLLTLLRSGIDKPAEPCGFLPVMSPEERQTLLDEWNATQKAYPHERTTLDLITDQCRSRPDQAAIRFGGQELTYAQLAKRVEHIAALLHGRGVGPGGRVAILLPRSPDLVASMLAAWRVGAAYVPLDFSFPKKRLDFMLLDAAVQAVLTSRDLVHMVPDQSSACVLSADDPSQHALATVAVTAGKASDSAYIIYTSGSTGHPKGVDIAHRGLVNFLVATQELVDFKAGDSLLAITTVSFDISAMELFLPLVAGGILELAEDGLAADGIRLAERIERCRPSFVQATASTWKTVLATGWGGDRDLRIMSAGESLSRDLAEELLVRSQALWNLYGPTETTIQSTAYRVQSAPAEPMRIGRPYPNTQLYILDAQCQPVPRGVVGELYIGGAGLARGYWGRPELTKERFIPSPVCPGERLYRTGDLARYLPSGDVICLGRMDDQVKIHGVRVELGEVEAALREIAGVSDAVVASWTDAQGNRQLVAHVLGGRSGAPPAAELRAQLRERLPEAMIPPYILFADAFPRTANGKVHRAALPLPAAVPNVPRKGSSAPVTPTERLLAEAWSRLLGIGVDNIHRDDDFLDLGGHSLLMTQLMLEVRKLFHVAFSMREFFAASTLQKFAALIDDRRRTRTAGTNGRQHARDSAWGKERMAFLEREAQLPRNIAPARGLIFKPQPECRAALLTGATGFLGAYIVAQVLRTTGVQLHCLVRPKRGESGRARIEQQLRNYELWSDDEAWRSAWERRVHVIEGDTTLPRLGITDTAYESLARDVDCVIHLAAHVNFIYPFEALRQTNVLGLHEIIRFAFHERIKPVHYLSTAAVWPMGAEYTFYETDPIEHGKLLNLGYDEAKWVGEKSLLHAAERGLPVARYRPGEVGGDSQTGRCVLDHFLIAAIKGFLQFGAFPALDMQLDVTPADYVAEAVVHLAFRRNPLGRAFHLTNPRRCHLSDALTFLRSLGYRFAECRFTDIRDRLINGSDFAGNALFPYHAVLEEMDDRSLQLPNYDCAETLRELEGSDIACPPVDDELFGTYMRYLRNIGYMPEPVEMTTMASHAS
jgi:amino acid adenylation domain-containing protein/thioester reductase-like protein